MNIIEELKRTLEHDHYQIVVNTTHSRMTFMLGGFVLGVVGPTRVGKSRAVREALRKLYPPSAVNFRPYIEVDASTTDSGFISTRYLTLTMLAAIEHPFYVGEEHGLRLNNTETVARIRLVKAIKHRGIELIFIDEAHHLLRTKSTRTALAALDWLKCLGNETGVKIVLAGSYELLLACFTSAHLNGRLSLIEFPRYKPVEADMKKFHRLLASLDPILPWASGQSLLHNWQLMYDGTLGCYGLLESWILTALSEMTGSGSKRLTREHFIRTRFQQQLEPIANEISRGESVLSPVAAIRNRSTVKSSPKKRKSKPGRRKPERDPVLPSAP